MGHMGHMGNAGRAAACSGLTVGRPPGFALYVDGTLHGVLQTGSVRDVAQSNDTTVQVG